MDIISKFLLEEDSIDNDVLFHGSPIQNLKIIKSSLISIPPHWKKEKVVFATISKKQAATFTFDREKVEMKCYPGHPWELIVKKSQKFLLLNPCSIYTIIRDKSFKNEITVDGIKTLDYISKREKVKVFSEEKFKTSLDCLEKYGTKIKWI